MSSPLAGAEMMTFFAPAAVDVRAGFGGIGEETGRLDDDVDAQLLPRQLARVSLAEDVDAPPVDLQRRIRRRRPLPP